MIIIPGQSGTYPHLRGLFQARLEVTVTVQMPEHIALFGFHRHRGRRDRVRRT